MKLVELFEAEQATPEEALDSFKHKDAADYGRKMIEVFGEPDGVTYDCLYWKKLDGMLNVRLKDESIAHSFPAKHRDFVYSDHEIEVPEHLYSVFAHVTGSIIIDGLKNLVSARCGNLFANAITLQFVKDVVDGNAPQTPEQAKEEYAKRIKGGKKPKWFKNTAKD